MTTPTHLSAAALTARIIEVASLIDAAGAHVWSLSVDEMTRHSHGLNGQRHVVTVFTDAAGFDALVGKLRLTVQPDSRDTVAASGLVGPFEYPVVVITGRGGVR